MTGRCAYRARVLQGDFKRREDTVISLTRSIRILIGLVALFAAPAALAEGPPFVAVEWTLPAVPGHLAGTLLLPAGEGPWPVTLILAGSGPTDRDGNSTQFPGGNNSLKQLAERLAAGGVAS